LRREVRWPGPGSTWTQRHMSWLRGLHFDDLCSQATLVDYLWGVEMEARQSDRMARVGSVRLSV